LSFLLDTNVLSEARRKSPAVATWIKATAGAARYCSVVSLGEIEKGIEMRRRSDLEAAAILKAWRERLTIEFGERVLPVTAEIALAWGRIAAGRTRDTADALIAATALVHGLTLVTRNIRDFADLPLRVLDPWAS
jgi:predicted nucleic acid-binding protein